MTGLEDLLVYTLPPTITSASALGVAWISARAGKRNEQKLHSIDKAVNGTQPDQPTLRELAAATNETVNGASPAEPTIREKIDALDAGEQT